MAEWWKLIYWAIGFFGVAGTILIIVFAPSILPLILKAVVGFFSLVLSYRVGCALVAAILAAVVADYFRHSHDDAVYAAKVAAFEQAQDDRDKRIAQETRDEVWKQIADATAENTVIDADVKEFHDALPPSPKTGNPFRVGADAPRLCRIAGKAQCGPQGAKGVPAPRWKPVNPFHHRGYGLPRPRG